MPTIHCPGCGRALHLPEFVESGAVSCPLCRMTFPPPAEELPVFPRRPAAVDVSPPPLRPWGAREQKMPPSPSSRPASPFTFDETANAQELLPDNRSELRKVAWWLRVFVVAASVQLVTCGCASNIALAHEFNGALGCIAVPIFLQLASLMFIFSGAEAIGRRRRRGLGVLGCVLTLIHSVVQLLPCLAFLPSRNDEPALLACSMVMALVVALVGFIAGIRGLTILKKPEVVESFQRRAGGEPE
jgi:hypothetical protein